MAAGLDELGITHLLVAQKDWGISYPQPLLNLLEDPARAPIVHQSPRHRVLELR